jgi:hypothetical protein
VNTTSNNYVILELLIRILYAKRDCITVNPETTSRTRQTPPRDTTSQETTSRHDRHTHRQQHSTHHLPFRPPRLTAQSAQRRQARERGVRGEGHNKRGSPARASRCRPCRSRPSLGWSCRSSPSPSVPANPPVTPMQARAGSPWLLLCSLYARSLSFSAACRPIHGQSWPSSCRPRQSPRHQVRRSAHDLACVQKTRQHAAAGVYLKLLDELVVSSGRWRAHQARSAIPTR